MSRVPDRDGPMERLRPIVRPFYRALKDANERGVHAIPHKARSVRARLSGASSRTILFHPMRPHPHEVLYRLLHARGWSVTNDATRPCDLAIAWYPTAVAPEAPALDALAASVAIVNRRCTDVSKRRVDEAAAQAFGYDIRVDPRRHVGPCVRKSDENALHDGAIVHCPIPTPGPGYVYQRVIDNAVDDATVEDIRLPVFGEIVPFAYRKYRPVRHRFSNVNSRVVMDRTEAALDPPELAALLAFCRSMGIEYAEIDALRDRSDGRLYVIDVNPTPYGPPNHLSATDAKRAMALMDRAFDLALGSRIAPARARTP
jgi:hypothetical protein